MMSQALTRAATNPQVAALACAGLLIFMAVFVGALMWTYRAGGEVYSEIEKLPFKNDTEVNA